MSESKKVFLFELSPDDPVFVYNGGRDQRMTPYKCLQNCMSQQAHQVETNCSIANHLTTTPFVLAL